MLRPHIKPHAFPQVYGTALVPQVEQGPTVLPYEAPWRSGQPKDALFSEVTPVVHTVHGLNLKNIAQAIAAHPRTRPSGRQSSAGRRWH